MTSRLGLTLWTAVLCFALIGPGLAAEQAAKSSTSEQMASAKETVQGAAEVVQNLRSNPETRETLRQARAVFVVPDYGKAGLGVGASGGEGVLVVNNEGTWSSPAFYNIGTISLGLQAGVEAGSIAFFIMTDEALEKFQKRNNFSLSANAGLTVINWSARREAKADQADVIAWADTEGLYGALAVSATDIFWRQKTNDAYYQQAASAAEIISGRLKAPGPASELESEFSALESQRPSGQSAPDEGDE